MDEKIRRELLEDTTLEDIPDRYREIVEIIGIEKFVEMADYARGDKVYFPKTESILAAARNRRIKQEYNGYNTKDLAQRYNLTIIQVGNILKDEPLVGQMSLSECGLY